MTMKNVFEYRQTALKEKYMKNGIGIWVLAAALVAPQTILWADEAPAGGASTPNTTVSTPQTKKPVHKAHHHHSKGKKPQASGASMSSQPATK